MSEVMGRFMSPDQPFVAWNLSNPQSFDLYGYVLNNPLSFIASSTPQDRIVSISTMLEMGLSQLIRIIRPGALTSRRVTAGQTKERISMEPLTQILCSTTLGRIPSTSKAQMHCSNTTAPSRPAARIPSREAI